MRPGTTLMDVIYRVTDPDDATVKVRALAFVDGVRSFANVIRPVTFVEGTEVNLGDAIATNADLTLTWDVAADWNIGLGQVKFEVLAVDSNGILPFDGITIPAAADKPELKINQIEITDEQVFSGLLWFYASEDPMMEIAYGTLQGSATSGVFDQKPVVAGDVLSPYYAQPFLFKLLNISYAGADILTYANAATRTPLAKDYWLTTNWPYVGSQFVYGWGNNGDGQINIPNLSSEAIAIAASFRGSYALKAGGTVVAWGSAPAPPAGLSDVTAIAAGSVVSAHALALKSDGTVVAWGYNGSGINAGKATVPVGLSGVTAIAAGGDHSMALKHDGTVVVWGSNAYGQWDIPAGLSGVSRIAAGVNFSLALKSDGTVVGWGQNNYGQTSIPEGLSGVSLIVAGYNHALALKDDGTVVGWGQNNYGCITIPAGLSGVTAISAGNSLSLALKSDGTVVAWGYNSSGQATVPTGLTGVTAIAAGGSHCVAVAKQP
ncbi:MAG: hypothetical protein K9N23_20155 [Akkermansiaceae bacterium]|nr:hypothetical protein [Akkermansiaceae bacterium]